MGTDLATTSNNVLDRFKGAEQKTQWIILAALGACAYFFSAPLLAFVERLRALAENILYLGIEVGIGALLVFLISDKKFRTMCGYYYHLGIRVLTSFMVRMDPIGIAETYVSELRKRISKFEDQIAKLWSQIISLRKQIGENEEAIGVAEKQCSYIKKHTDNPQANPAFITNALQAQRKRESNTRLSALLKQLEGAHKILSKLREWAVLVMEDTINAVENAKTEQAASKAAFGAFSSALSIIRDNSDGKDLYDQAMATLGSNFAERMGAIEEFAHASDGLLASIDIGKGIVAEDMLNKLETMQTRLLGSVSPEVIDVSATVVPASSRQPVLAQNNTALFLDDETKPPRR